MKKSSEGISKFLYDYLPIIVFFVCYKFIKAKNPIVFATISMLVVTLFGILVSYILTRKIPKVATFSGVVLAIFCGLSIYFNDEIFIKIKPTIINMIFAIILFYGCYAKKPFLSYLIGDQIKISQTAWLILSKRWGLFFIFLAVLNEFIWRNFSNDFWVQFKVFGMMTSSILFSVSQVPFILNEAKKINEK